jgi:holo-[acyl-carrier protein] synthase
MRIIGHGIDITEVARIGRMHAEHGDRFLERCFTAGERAYAGDRKRRDEHLAGRFAAKEAVLKALGTGWDKGIAWTDVEVVLLPSGQPTVRLSGRAAEIANDLGIAEWSLSISHTEAHAIASAIASSV